MVAAHELAANAVRHGAGRGRLRLRADGAFLYCQASDDGPARLVDQQPAGTASWRREHGHGLWLVDQVADQFSIDHGPAGTTVTAAFALCSPPGPDQLVPSSGERPPAVLTGRPLPSDLRITRVFSCVGRRLKAASTSRSQLLLSRRWRFVTERSQLTGRPARDIRLMRA